ncbi:MAG: hypothetical protein ACRENY_09335 [Candidatus Dormibacteria bacterium]
MAETRPWVRFESNAEGQFAVNGPDLKVEAFFVNFAQSAQRDLAPHPDPRLTRADLIFMLGAKRRNWRRDRASAAERATILQIGGRLERSGLSARQFAKTSFGLAPSTYLAWKARSGGT